MQCGLCHQIDSTAEDLAQIMFEIVDQPSEPSVRPQRVEQVDVTVDSIITTADGAEQFQTFNSVALTGCRESLEINAIDCRHGPDDRGRADG